MGNMYDWSIRSEIMRCLGEIVMREYLFYGFISVGFIFFIYVVKFVFFDDNIFDGRGWVILANY